MIVRVFRAKTHPGKEAEFEQKVRELSIPLVKRQSGMVMYFAGNPLDSDSQEFVMVTLWNSTADLKCFAGEDWRQAVIPEEELSLLSETTVHHYDVFSSSASRSNEIGSSSSSK